MASRIEWRRSGVPLLLVLTSLLLTLGLTLPALRTESALSSSAHSVLGGIRSLFLGGNVVLALVVLLFSAAFPIVKLVALILIWTQRVEEQEQKIVWLGFLGKWSMLDVFVVAIFVGAIELGALAEFAPEPGIYVFAAAILSTMVSTHVVEHVKGFRQRIREVREGRLQGGLVRFLNVATLVLFGVGISLPLMKVEKWAFWSSESSLLETLWRLGAEGRVLLAALMALFVLLFPVLYYAGLACVRWTSKLSGRRLRALLVLEEWAMLDVFAVALLVVIAQVAGTASFEPRLGLWFFLAAVLTASLDSWLLRRALREPASA